ncbi:MAG: hypothetical protein ACOC2N_08345, partial [Spirochaetota bacterium]
MSTTDRGRRRLRLRIARILGIALILFAWALASRMIDASIILPGPVVTVARLWREMTGGEFYRHL